MMNVNDFRVLVQGLEALGLHPKVDHDEIIEGSLDGPYPPAREATGVQGVNGWIVIGMNRNDPKEPGMSFYLVLSPSEDGKPLELRRLIFRGKDKGANAWRYASGLYLSADELVAYFARRLQRRYTWIGSEFDPLIVIREAKKCPPSE